MEHNSVNAKGASEDADRALSLREVASRLGVSIPTVMKLGTEGRLPVLRVGKRWLVPVKGLRTFLASASGRKK